MSVRRITSLTVLISFVLSILTSAILYITPHGRVAYWADWRLWGLSKTQWTDLHLNLGILLVLAGVLHTIYNWGPITMYLKNRARRLKVFTTDFNVALLIAVFVAAGTYFRIPPMSTVIDASESVKDAAGVRYGEPPYGHAELSSLKAFAGKVDLDLAESMELLRRAGIRFENETQTVEEIAAANDLSPKQLYEIMKPAAVKTVEDEHAGLPDTPPPGFGRMELVDFCAGFDLDITGIIDALLQKGVEAEPGQSIREIAEENGMVPMAVFEMIRGVVDTP